MDEHAQKLDFAALQTKLTKLRSDANAEFERIVANIDESDPDQVNLVQPEIDRLLADFNTKITDTMANAILRVAVIEPMAKMLGVDFAAGGEVNLSRLSNKA